MIAWRLECLLISIEVTNYLPYPQLEALPVYLSFNTTLSDKLLIVLLKSHLCHPKAAQLEVYLDNLGAIWKRKTICLALLDRTEYC